MSFFSNKTYKWRETHITKISKLEVWKICPDSVLTIQEFVFGINRTLITNLFGFALISVAPFLPEIALTFLLNASEQTIDVSLPFNQIFLNQLISKAFIRLSSMWEFYAGLC